MNISFSLTKRQFRARAKDVTRRLGWNKAKVGQVLDACEKCQGLKKGEHPVKMGKIIVVKVNREPLNFMLKDADYGKSECEREGFPHLTPVGFVRMFCEHNKCKPSQRV